MFKIGMFLVANSALNLVLFLCKLIFSQQKSSPPQPTKSSFTAALFLHKAHSTLQNAYQTSAIIYTSTHLTQSTC